MVAPVEAQTLRGYADDASRLANLVAAIEDQDHRRAEALDRVGQFEEDVQEAAMYWTAMDVLFKEAKRISRELEKGLDVLATRMEKVEGA